MTYTSLLKVLIKNQNTPSIRPSGKKGLPKNVSAALSMLPLSVLLAIICGFLTVMVPSLKTLAAIVNVCITAMQFMTLFTMMSGIVSLIYNGDDAPFLNSLPIRSGTVFLAKITSVYITLFFYLASLLLIPLFTVGIVYAVVMETMFYAYFVLIFVILLLAPVLPIFIITLLSLPITYIGTFFKGKAVLKTILSLLFYVILMVGYFAVILLVNNDMIGSAMSASTLKGLSVFTNVAYVNKVISEFALGISMAKNFGIAAGIYIGMIGLTVGLGYLFFRRISLKNAETVSDNKDIATSFKKRGKIASLMKLDFFSIIRNPKLATSSLLTIIMCPVLVAIMSVIAKEQEGAEAISKNMQDIMQVGYALLYTVLFLGAANPLAIQAYTRDGKKVFINKSLPIKAEDSVNAKLLFTLIPSGISLVISFIVVAVLYKLNILNMLMFVLLAPITVIGLIGANIYCDVRFGNVNWNDIKELRQSANQNKGSILVALWGVFIGMCALIGAIILMTYSGVLGERNALIIYWSVLAVLAVITFVTGLVLVEVHAPKYYSTLGERKPKSSGKEPKIKIKL